MGSRNWVLLLVVITQIWVISAQTNSLDAAALRAIKSSWENLPPNWKGGDPCGSNWEGIKCTNTSVTSMTLSGMNIIGREFGDIPSLSGLRFLDLSNNRGLRGTLPSKIGELKNLAVLILVGCSFNGPIPESIGSLNKLLFLALNNNSFSGEIPASMGSLTNLTWLDLTDNRLHGRIPVSNSTSPGLDMLVKARHFHMGRNQLSGVIPPQLFSSNMSLLHVVFDNNQLTGNIPSTIGDVPTLEVVRLEWNSLNGSIPQNLSNLRNLSELHLSNNKLTGLIPNISGMDRLNYVDMSNNSFDASEFPPWFPSLPSLATLLMEHTQLQGQVPAELFNLPHLLTVVLSNNQLNGTLNVSTGYSDRLTLDLRNNSIGGFIQGEDYNMELELGGNPICNGIGATARYCNTSRQPNSAPLTPSNNCTSAGCSSGMISSPKCICAHPYIGVLHFVIANISTANSASIMISGFEEILMSDFISRQLHVNAISLVGLTISTSDYVELILHIFPSGQERFNRTGISDIGSALNHQRYWRPGFLGPSFYIDENYFIVKKSPDLGVIIGATIGGFVLVILLFFAGVYGIRQRRRATKAIAQNNPFASWQSDQGNGSIPQLNATRSFSFDELKKCTDNFSEANCIGFGGYGKVYRGTLDIGQLVAIKRAKQGSLQEALQFKTEIELLSRTHHKNIVNLVGFCYERGEQMLVYEYIENGTLKDSLSGKSGIRLNWIRRLKIALDSARGIAYLHDLANPPIIHRDIKSNNILLDDHLNAKVADFGISKLLADSDKDYVSTQVKGTMGYMDPEYFSTLQLTDKSDVYGFGVVLLELITARGPIVLGKHIVNVVQEAIKGNPRDQNKINNILDPVIESGITLVGLEKFLNLSMSCVKESAADRPTMSKVVREIENILNLAALDHSEDSTSTSSVFESAEIEAKPYNSYGSSSFFDNSRRQHYTPLNLETL